MDAHQLTEEGYYGIYGKAGARMEMPHNPDVRFDADPL
jgi:aconitase B